MEFNDGSQYRVVTDPAAQLRERTVYCFRTASARDGARYVDTAHERHRRDLAAMPALLMYQFVWQNAGSPEDQASFLVDAVGGRLAPNEMVMLDIETGGGIADPAGFARRWLDVAEGALGTRAWLYVPGGLATALAPVVQGRIVMAPHYSGNPTWAHDAHQYTDRGYFPGCAQTGDVSRTSLTAELMLARCATERNPMAVSYNGWTAAPGWTVAGGQLEPLVVAGEPFSPGVRAGDVHDVLEYVAQQLHARVEPVVRSDWHQADDWGYSYRANANNPDQLSCHASATAIDYNATRHPNGKTGTWTAAQKAEINKILAEVDGTVRNLANDEMHFEICKGAAAVAAAAAKIRGGAPKPPPGPPVLAWGGEIAALYDRSPQELKDALGPLTQSERVVPGGAVAPFTHGAIYWTPGTGPRVVRGGIFEAYGRAGWEGGKLGFPVTDEFGATLTDRAGQPYPAVVQLFQAGSIVWTPTGAAVNAR